MKYLILFFLPLFAEGALCPNEYAESMLKDKSAGKPVIHVPCKASGVDKCVCVATNIDLDTHDYANGVFTLNVAKKAAKDAGVAQEKAAKEKKAEDLASIEALIAAGTAKLEDINLYIKLKEGL